MAAKKPDPRFGPLKVPANLPARKKTSRIVVHTLDTDPLKWKEDIREVDRWHREERGWKAIGYHYVIFRDGSIIEGRPLDVVGAHCEGWNSDSVGIALSGGKNAKEGSLFSDLYTADQHKALATLCYAVTRLWRNIPVVGHRDHPKVTKLCPGFDAAQWWAAAQETYGWKGR